MRRVKKAIIYNGAQVSLPCDSHFIKVVRESFDYILWYDSESENLKIPYTFRVVALGDRIPDGFEFISIIEENDYPLFVYQRMANM